MATNNMESDAKEYKEGDIIFLEFEPGDKFYLIQSGSVRIIKMVSDIEKTIDIITVGDFFGEMAILEEAPRSAGAIANEHSVIIEFKRDNFESLLTSNPMLTLKILRGFATRIFDAKKRLLILQFKDPEIRVYSCFLLLAEIKHIKRELYLKPQIFDTTPEDIASWCALSVMQTNHVISKLIRLNKVSMGAKSIVVNNLDEFQRIIDKKRKAINIKSDIY